MNDSVTKDHAVCDDRVLRSDVLPHRELSLQPQLINTIHSSIPTFTTCCSKTCSYEPDYCLHPTVIKPGVPTLNIALLMQIMSAAPRDSELGTIYVDICGTGDYDQFMQLSPRPGPGVTGSHINNNVIDTIINESNVSHQNGTVPIHSNVSSLEHHSKFQIDSIHQQQQRMLQLINGEYDSVSGIRSRSNTSDHDGARLTHRHISGSEWNSTMCKWDNDKRWWLWIRTANIGDSPLGLTNLVAKMKSSCHGLAGGRGTIITPYCPMTEWYQQLQQYSSHILHVKPHPHVLTYLDHLTNIWIPCGSIGEYDDHSFESDSDSDNVTHHYCMSVFIIHSWSILPEHQRIDVIGVPKGWQSFHIQPKVQINVSEFQSHLKSHPDQMKVDRVLQAHTIGADVGCCVVHLVCYGARGTAARD